MEKPFHMYFWLYLENIRSFGNGHKWHETAVTPAFDSYPWRIHGSICCSYMLESCHLIFYFNLAQMALDLSLFLVESQFFSVKIPGNWESDQRFLYYRTLQLHSLVLRTFCVVYFVAIRKYFAQPKVLIWLGRMCYFATKFENIMFFNYSDLQSGDRTELLEDILIVSNHDLETSL